MMDPSRFRYPMGQIWFFHVQSGMSCWKSCWTTDGSLLAKVDRGFTALALKVTMLASRPIVSQPSWLLESYKTTLCQHSNEWRWQHFAAKQALGKTLPWGCIALTIANILLRYVLTRWFSAECTWPIPGKKQFGIFINSSCNECIITDVLFIHGENM